VIFCAAIASALARGLVIDCGCFGASIPSRERMWLDLGRDLLLVAAAATVYGCSSSRWSSMSRSPMGGLTPPT
jgi:hypothetical protein